MKTLLQLLILAAPILAHSQTGKSDVLDATLAVGNREGSLAIHFARVWKLGAQKKFGIGLGGRFTAYAGQNQYYITAPAKLTSGSTGPLVIFKENIVENIDTLLINSPFVSCLNLSINLHYELTEKWQAGFNIDAIGFSFGGNKRGNYINGFTGSFTEAKPTSFNALLISDNDLGSLNSELFVRYQLNERLGLKFGASFLFTEYTTTTKVQTFPEENDRFRKKSLMLGLGVSYKIQ